MEARAPRPTGLDAPGLVVRQRHCRLALEPMATTERQLAAYLALVDRPVSALLARDRLRRLQPGLFTYSSRPFRLLRFELVPSLELLAVWEGGELSLRCSDCRIVGLGRLERALRFDLSARLRPVPEGIDGLARVSLALLPGLPAWSLSLAGTALEQVLDRVEHRLQRGLRKDLLTWLLDPAVSG
jgi:hypothetical protein